MRPSICGLVRRVRTVRSALPAGLLLLALAGCGGGADEPEVPPSVNLTSPIGTTMPSGTEVTLVVATTDRQGRPVASPTVSFASSNVEVATVSATGTLRAIRTGTASITATSSGVTASLAITVTPGAPASLVITTQPADAANGRALGTQPVLEVRDANGNRALTPAINVTAEVVGGGRLVGQTTVVTAQGIATFAGLSIEGTTGARTLRFTASNVTPVSSASFTLLAGTAVRLALRAQPADAVAGEVLATAPIIDVLDGSDNVVTTATVPVTVAVTGTDVTLSGASTVAAQGGVATFAGLAISGRVGQVQLQFTAANLPAVSTAAFALRPGPARSMVLRTPPSSMAASGVALISQPVIELRDAFANLATTSALQVTATISGTGALSGNSVTASQGVATFSSLTMVGLIGQRTLTFNATGVPAITSGAISLQSGPPGALVLRTPPSGGGLNAPFAVQPVIEVRDGAGNLSPLPNVLITATLAEGSGALSGTVSVNSLNGIAPFVSLGISGSGGARTIRFGSTGLTAVTAAVTPCDAQAEPRAVLSPTSVSITLVRQTPPADALLDVTEANGTCSALPAPTIIINYQNATTGWLSVTPVQNGTRLQFRVTPGTLPVGTLTANVTVVIGNTTVVVPVSFTLQPAAILTYGSAGQKINELGIGNSLRIVPTLQDELGNPLAAPVTLVSRSPTVVSVIADGTFTAQSGGSAWLVASTQTNGGAIDSIYVNVRATNGPVVRTELTRFDFSQGSTIQVPVLLDTRGVSVGTAQVTVTWPTELGSPSLLRFVSAVPGGLGTQSVSNDSVTGTTRLTFSSVVGNAGLIPLGQLEFTAVGLGTGQISVRITDLLAPSGTSLLGTVSNLSYPIRVR